MNDFGLDLAVIGNGQTAALIEPASRIVWWCYPRLDGDPVFSRLVAGQEEKGFSDVVIDDMVDFSSDYERNAPIVSTTLTDGRGGCDKDHRFLAAIPQLRPCVPSAATDAHHRAGGWSAPRNH